MKPHTSFTITALMLVWLAGILLAVGSKSYDPDEEEPVPPVLVEFSVANNGTISVEDGSTNDSITNVVISGSFEKGGSDDITLREVPVYLDTSTTFTASVTPTEGANLLEGTLVVEISQQLEFGLDRLPSSGQLSFGRNGTTTLITFDGNADNVIVAVGNTTLPALSFNDFRDVYSDQDRALDERFASKAYRTLETLWLMSRFSETAQRTIAGNLDLIEAMGFNSPLELTCSNAGGSPTPAYSVAWTVDPAGSGLGTAGDGDTFEYSMSNCELSSEDRFFQQAVQIAGYQLNNDEPPRGMSYTAVFSSMIIAEETIESAIPALTRQRISGTLSVSADEGETITNDN